MQVPEAVIMILDQLRQQAATISDSEAREAWMKSVKDMESQRLTTKDGLRHALKELGGNVSLACWALGNLRDDDAILDLLDVLRRGDQFSFEAAKALRTIGNPRSAPALIEVLVAEVPAVARQASAYALGIFRQAEVENALSAVLIDQHERTDVRAACAEALGHGHFRGAVSALASATTDSSPEVRYWSLYALGELGDPAALPVVAARMRDLDRTSAGDSIAEEATRVHELLVERSATG
jgi:HEAT repeat protein